MNQWYRDVPRRAHWSIIWGIAVLLVGGVGFGTWAGLAPLEGAVITSGSFVATGQNKQVQHLEGGIIREMRATEGGLVEAAQPLLRLDDTAAKAKLRRLTLRKYRLMAIKAGVEAEIHSSGKLQWPRALLDDTSNPEVISIIQKQETELAARRITLLTQEEVLRKEISGLKESIRGYEAQAESNHIRLALFDEELADKKALLERQLLRKTEVLELRRAQASLSGELGALLGRIGDAKDRVARAEQQIAQLRAAAVERAVKELREAESELDDIEEQIRAARDVLDRTEIRAPVRGIVVKLNRHTPGGVVAPGDVILELVPVNDELVIEGRVNPRDITHVNAGQDALVRLTALSQRLTPMIKGKVIYVSADAVPEQSVLKGAAAQTSDSFVIRVRLDDQDALRTIEKFRPMPGMPADLYIKTGERTFFNYVLRPILDSFSRAFREQ